MKSIHHQIHGGSSKRVCEPLGCDEPVADDAHSHPTKTGFRSSARSAMSLFPPESSTDPAVIASPPGGHSDSGVVPLHKHGLRRGTTFERCLEAFGWLASLAMIAILYIAFADASQTSAPEIELPKWKWGKPQTIEATLFP